MRTRGDFMRYWPGVPAFALIFSSAVAAPSLVIKLDAKVSRIDVEATVTNSMGVSRALTVADVYDTLRVGSGFSAQWTFDSKEILALQRDAKNTGDGKFQLCTNLSINAFVNCFRIVNLYPDSGEFAFFSGSLEYQSGVMGPIVDVYTGQVVRHFGIGEWASVVAYDEVKDIAREQQYDGIARGEINDEGGLWVHDFAIMRPGESPFFKEPLGSGFSNIFWSAKWDVVATGLPEPKGWLILAPIALAIGARRLAVLRRA